MSNDKVVTMPGVVDTDVPVVTSESFIVEESLLADLGDVLESYNGRISNVSMLGCLNLITMTVTLSSLGEGDE